MRVLGSGRACISMKRRGGQSVLGHRVFPVAGEGANKEAFYNLKEGCLKFWALLLEGGPVENVMGLLLLEGGPVEVLGLAV